MNFQISEYAVCVDKTVHSKSPKWDLYPLIITSDYKDCPTLWDIQYDNRYIQAGSVKESALLDDNNIEELISDLPMIEEYYNAQNTYEWGLFFTSAYQFKSECES